MASASKSHLRAAGPVRGRRHGGPGQVLSSLKILELPNGGSVTVGMFPIFFYCARWGFGPGMIASFAYALLQLFLDGAYAWGWQSMIGDYILAFAVLGLRRAVLEKEKRLLPGRHRRLRRPVLGPLCGGRHRLGLHHAGGVLRHDHDLPLVLLPALQRQLHGDRLDPGRRHRPVAAKAHEEMVCAADRGVTDHSQMKIRRSQIGSCVFFQPANSRPISSGIVPTESSVVMKTAAEASF